MHTSRDLILILLLSIVTLNCRQGAREQNANSAAMPEGKIENKLSEAKHKLLWRKLKSFNEAPSAISFRDQQNGIAVGSEEQFWLTTDAGKTWTEKRIRGQEIAARGGAYNLVKVVFTPQGFIYAIGHLEEAGSAVFMSPDSGKTWETVYYPNRSLAAVDSFADKVWLIADGSTLMLYPKSTGIWKGSGNQVIEALDFIDAQNGWLVGVGGGILHTTNGGKNWDSQPSPTRELLSGVSFADTKTGYAVGSNGVILHTRDGGNSWSQQSGGVQSNLAKVVAINESQAFIVGEQGMILYTTDAGRKWWIQDIDTKADVLSLSVKENTTWLVTADGGIFEGNIRP